MRGFVCISLRILMREFVRVLIMEIKKPTQKTICVGFCYLSS
jgi:hypothetical protein